MKRNNIRIRRYKVSFNKKKNTTKMQNEVATMKWHFWINTFFAWRFLFSLISFRLFFQCSSVWNLTADINVTEFVFLLPWEEQWRNILRLSFSMKSHLVFSTKILTMFHLINLEIPWHRILDFLEYISKQNKTNNKLYVGNSFVNKSEVEMKSDKKVR